MLPPKGLMIYAPLVLDKCKLKIEIFLYGYPNAEDMMIQAQN